MSGMDVCCTTVYEGILLRTCVVRSPPEGERKGNVRAKLQKAHDSTNPSPPHVTPHPHRILPNLVHPFTTRDRDAAARHFPLPRATHLDDVAVHRFASRNNLYYQRPRFRVRTHARTQPQKSARRLAPRRASRVMPTAKSQSPPRVARANQTKPNQTKPHMTHIHTTARTRGLLPAVLSPLSLSLSLSRGAACLRLSSPPPRHGLLLSSPNLSLARRINIALASPPLSRLASERTNGRASGERGEPEAGGLCASVSLLPSSPPSPFSALLSIPAVQGLC
ncbi:hypothetical protein DAI22_06g241303 [Oryza sativa Japonica Group]|nr:hypothetical protein DAI22_06g241303 [Oryza sativa Japonica Group]